MTNTFKAFGPEGLKEFATFKEAREYALKLANPNPQKFKLNKDYTISK